VVLKLANSKTTDSGREDANCKMQFLLESGYTCCKDLADFCDLVLTAASTLGVVGVCVCLITVIQ